MKQIGINIKTGKFCRYKNTISKKQLKRAGIRPATNEEAKKYIAQKKQNKGVTS